MRVGIEKLGVVNAIMQHEEIYPYSKDDYTPGKEDITFASALENPNCYVLMPNEGSVFFFTPHNAVFYEAHGAVLPEFRGKTVEAYKRTRDWMYTNTGCRKIIGFCPEDNARTHAFCVKAGLIIEGRITASFLKDGNLIDLILFSHPGEGG